MPSSWKNEAAQRNHFAVCCDSEDFKALDTDAEALRTIETDLEQTLLIDLDGV